MLRKIFTTRRIFCQGFKTCSSLELDKNSKITKESILNIINEKRNNTFKNHKTLSVSSSSVFVNNDIGLRYINYYGFDYDFTLAEYNYHLNPLIYNMVIQMLQSNLGYPSEISKFGYNPAFDCQGLHFDLKTGFTLKLDASNHLCLGTLREGHVRLNDNRVFEHYNNTHIPIFSVLEGNESTSRFWQANDKFNSPLMCILSDLVQLFKDQNITISPFNLWHDVMVCARLIHVNGSLHKEITSNIDKYLTRNSKSSDYLTKLVADDKKLFILTNSNFEFLNCGMTFLYGKDWRDLFEVVITSARKPSFFKSQHTHFKEVDIKYNKFKWTPVSEFKKGSVYSDGNIELFKKFTKWNSMSILYFGDHLQSDLMEPVLMQGWRTGAIVSELENEIQVENNPAYQQDTKWIRELEDIMKFCYMNKKNGNFDGVLTSLKAERQEVRERLRKYYKSHYGSLFRSYRVHTNYMKLLAGCSDIYTSAIGNMLQYPLDITFYAKRQSLPHSIDEKEDFLNTYKH